MSSWLLCKYSTSPPVVPDGLNMTPGPKSVATVVMRRPHWLLTCGSPTVGMLGHQHRCPRAADCWLAARAQSVLCCAVGLSTRWCRGRLVCPRVSHLPACRDGTSGQTWVCQPLSSASAWCLCRVLLLCNAALLNRVCSALSQQTRCRQ
jgi:hypothetical protein